MPDALTLDEILHIMIKNVIGVSSVDYSERASALVDECMDLAGTNYSQAASRIIKNGKPLSRQSFFKMAKSGSIKLSTFMAMLDAYDLEMEIRRKSESGAEKMAEKSE